MSELNYAFTNQDGVLLNTAVFDSNNLDILEVIKDQYNASSYYPIDNQILFPFVIGKTYWNGDRFINPAPYPSWILNEQEYIWEAPIPQPTFNPESPKFYEWNEDILNWEEIQVSE